MGYRVKGLRIWGFWVLDSNLDFRVKGLGCRFLNHKSWTLSLKTSILKSETLYPNPSTLYDKVPGTTSRLRRLRDLRLSRLSRLVIDLETHFCTVNPVSISFTSREVVKVVRSQVVKSSKSWCGPRHFVIPYTLDPNAQILSLKP
jgi:hypothetical protein